LVKDTIMKNLFKLIICTLFFATSCGENFNEVITSDETPDKVIVTKVENGPGKSRIYFNLPDSKSLLFVEATFQDDDKSISAKASSYNNFIELEGFSEAKEYKVILHSVSRGMNKSEPLEVAVNPETPPYQSVYNALDIAAATGGFNVSITNTAEAELVYIIEKFDRELNEWTDLETFYRKDAEVQLKIRDQVGENLLYRMKIRDKFLHYSDYKEFTITPAIEQEMDYSLFAEVNLANDPLLFTITAGNYQPHEYLWNQKLFITDQATNGGGWIGTAMSGYTSYWMSWDLGKQAQLSRIVIFQRGVSGTGSISPYTSHNIKDFEIWGSNNPSADGSWDSWERIMVETIVKPAGSTADVLEISKRGDSFTFDEDLSKYRYIRLKGMNTFQNPRIEARFFLAGIRLFEAM
jgi:hypothetical protein